MKAYAIIGLVVFLLLGVRFTVGWIETGAVSRFESAQLAHAARAKDESLAEVRSLSQEAREEQRQEVERARQEIDELESRSARLRREAKESAAAAEAAIAEAAAVIADVDTAEQSEIAQPGELCKIGCTPRWITKPQ